VQQNIQQVATSRPPGTMRDMEQVRAFLARQGAMGDFNRGTRQSILTLSPIAFSQGQPTKLDLPQTGFLSDIYCIFSGTTTTAAASSTTIKSYIPTPLGIARRVRVFNNQGVDVWNTSAWGCALVDMAQKTHFSPLTEQGGQFQYANAFGTSQNVFTRYRNTDASLGASASQNWRWPAHLSIAWGPALQAGLQLLQDPAIRYSLEVGWGDATDLYSATTGTVTLSNVQCLPTVVLYHVPERSVDLPKLSFTKTVLEDQQPLLTGSGDNVYKFVTGNMATKVILEYVNTPASVQTPIFPTGASANASVNPITRVKARYSQTQIPYDIDCDSQYLIQRERYAQDLPGAVICHELSMPNGLPELVGVRDIINTARLTDLDFIATLSGVTLANGFIRGIREQLVKNR
jgi:hypothetical protein